MQQSGGLTGGSARGHQQGHIVFIAGMRRGGSRRPGPVIRQCLQIPRQGTFVQPAGKGRGPVRSLCLMAESGQIVGG